MCGFHYMCLLEIRCVCVLPSILKHSMQTLRWLKRRAAILIEAQWAQWFWYWHRRVGRWKDRRSTPVILLQLLWHLFGGTWPVNGRACALAGPTGEEPSRNRLQALYSATWMGTGLKGRRRKQMQPPNELEEDMRTRTWHPRTEHWFPRKIGPWIHWILCLDRTYSIRALPSFNFVQPP